MNYLAHLYLSPPDEDALLGSLLGDFVKGPLGARYAGGVGEAIMLHRRLDSFTDAHPAVRRSKARMSPARRRVAGVMVDLFYDHFLARDWARHHPAPLESFTGRVYALLARRHTELPERLQTIAPRMAELDWLGSYAGVGAIGIALERMGRRLSRGNPLAGGEAELRLHYAAFEADFAEFLPDVRAQARRLGGA